MKMIFLVFPLIISSILNIEADIIKGIYNNFTNITSHERHTFYLKVSVGQTVNISYIMNYKTDNKEIIPFYYIDYKEYEFKNGTNLGKAIGSFLRPELKNNEYILSYSHNISSYKTNYLFIQIFPLVNFTFFAIKAEADGGAFDLESNIPKTIYNLTSGNLYSFYVPAKVSQSVTITLTMDKMDLPFDSLNIYEQPSRIYDVNSNKFKLGLKIKEKINQLKMSISFVISLAKTQCIRFFFVPKYDIKYLTAQIDVN